MPATFAVVAMSTITVVSQTPLRLPVPPLSHSLIHTHISLAVPAYNYYRKAEEKRLHKLFAQKLKLFPKKSKAFVTKLKKY